MSEHTGETYTIASLRDLYAVPDDRLEVCLSEMGEWVRLTKAAEAFGAFLAEAAGVEGPGIEARQVFQWIDDGERNVSLNFSIADEHTTESNPSNTDETPE